MIATCAASSSSTSSLAAPGSKRVRTFQVPIFKAARTSSFEKGFRWFTTEGALDLPLPDVGQRLLLAAAPFTSLALFDLLDFIMWTFLRQRIPLAASRASVR